jgi:acyl-homoserine lactone acylase PvdQ
MKIIILIFILPIQLFAQSFTKIETARWAQQAKRVNIIRDNWGIPHVYGKSDADAVFGLLFAQCEDDFKRVEMNYIEKLGRLSEVKGESELYNDLYLKLVIDSAAAVADFKKSPAWLQKLMNAFADGINYYLYKNPAVKPALLHRFQPWYPLLWTDGSIAAISTGDITEGELKNFYTGNDAPIADNQKNWSEMSSGSNGFAIAPSKTASGNAILYINPHVSFYFRPEVQMVSEEGLNVYGAVTWGQFFVYQGFNQYCGWMHTSSNVDVSDLYAEKITKKGNDLFYEYEHTIKPVTQQKISIRYKKDNLVETKNFTGFFTQHGPLMAKRNGQYISVKSYNRALASLIQSWERTKAKGLDDYKKNMAMYANTSNNTVFADNKGNIAYWHGDFVPRRDKSLNWSKPVDGSIAATEWQGPHTLDEIVHVYNPTTGWIQNCNSTPFSVSGASSPKKENYPPYMAPDGENFRGINAARVLSKENAFTIDKTISAGFDTYLAAFEILVPPLIASFEKNIQPGDSLFALLAEPIAVLKKWDYRVAENSIATTLAIEWGQNLTADIRKIYINEGEEDQVTATKKFVAAASVNDLVNPLLKTVNDLNKRFGNWQIPWGTINRYQRVSGEPDQQFNDQLLSFPVAFTSSLWGMLPSFKSSYFPSTNKRYGNGGNSFICAVEFGKRIKAKSLLAGGESGNPLSTHFNDQLEMYTKGKFKEVLFYKEDVEKHAERTYHPGE